jgi:NADH-quinone oxidoreductase subunit G
VADLKGGSEPISVTIDGRVVEAQPGELIISVAERAGIFIPRFCYHPRMKSVGMCRMCLVEVSGPRGSTLQPACFAQVVDGQEVFTQSEAARKAQEGVLEFLLVNHPLDCPVCDKGGECPLQDQAVSHGPGESRFVEEKRHWAKPIEIGPLVLLDRERCIQCARCTRFAKEVAGEPFIDFAERGDRIEVAIFPDEPFTSYFGGNTVQICPVGALTSTPYRFKSRPWDLEQVETTCTTCAVGCRMAAQSSAGALVRYLGIDSGPVNQGWLCDRGRYGFAAVEAPGRLGQPLVRRESELVPATWNEALGDVADQVVLVREDSGAAAIGVIGGARLANEDAYAWVKLIKGVIGTDNFDAQVGDGLPAELLASLPRATIDETVAASMVIVLAGDLREELPVLHLRLHQAAANDGLRILECSPVATALSVVATRTPYLPGEEVELARTLVATESGDGVVIVLGRPSLAGRADNVAAAASVLAEAWPQARFLSALRRGNVHGAIDLGCAPGLLPGRVALEDGRDWFSGQWGSAPAQRGLDTARMLETAASGELRMLVLLGADPLADFPDRDLAKRALEGVEFLVAVDTTLNASSMLADVVLPASGYAERGGTTMNLEGRVTRLAAKVVPPGVARADWVVAAELAERLGGDLGFESLEAIWVEIERVAPAFSGCTNAALGGLDAADGVVIPLRAEPVRLTGHRARLDPMATPGIKSVEEQGAPLSTGAATSPGAGPFGEGQSPRDVRLPVLVKFEPGRWPAASQGPTVGEDNWRLVVRRALYDYGTLVQSAGLLASFACPQELHMAPGDVVRLGVETGEMVRARSPRGELEVRAVADEDVPPGVALLRFNSVPVDKAGASGLVDVEAQVVELTVEKVV